MSSIDEIKAMPPADPADHVHPILTEDGLLNITEATRRMKSLAAWLEMLPPAYALTDVDERPIVIEPHVCARILRLMLPAESRT